MIDVFPLPSMFFAFGPFAHLLVHKPWDPIGPPPWDLIEEHTVDACDQGATDQGSTPD